MTSLLEKKFIIVTGKGGVGRTTLSLVIGRFAANAGKRTLVCLSNAPPRYNDLLGDVVLSSSIREVGERLEAVNLDPQASQEEYGLKVLRNRTLHRLIFGSRIVRGFLDAVPGLAEWAILGKATFHALKTSHRQPKYDIVVLDSPATGHGLDILALPRAIVTAVPGGRMRDEALARCELMEDPERTEVIPVTVPEQLPVNETVEFVRRLRAIGLHYERIVLNMTVAKLVSAELQELIESTINSTIDIPSWLIPSAAELGRHSEKEENTSRLSREIPVPQIVLPFIPGGSLDENSILTLLEAFTDGIGRN